MTEVDITRYRTTFSRDVVGVYSRNSSTSDHEDEDSRAYKRKRAYST